MGTFMDVTYSYVYSLCQYFKGAWPLSLIYGQNLKKPSQDTTGKIYQALDLLINSADSRTLKQVHSLIESLPEDEDLLCVVDPVDGFDILQHAVIKRLKGLVMLLLWKQHCPNRYSCSPPLHIAAFLGHISIIEILLKSGEAPADVVGMCYPDSHQPTGHQNFLFGFTQVPIYNCQRNKHSAIECAISQNHVECLDLMLNFVKGKSKAASVSPVNMMHFACKEGAAGCISYFLKHYPQCINEYNGDGDTPLLTAVPWGRECVKILVDSGADLHLVSKKDQETALHRLYRMNIDGLFSIHDTTKYLLTTGIEQDINALTTLGETALHMLVSHISYTGGNYVKQSLRKVPRSFLQENYQQQVVNSLKTLLSFNADPAMLNGYGLQALSRMLHIALKSCNPDNPCPCVQTSIFTYLIKDYRNNYWSLGQAMKILFQHNANPNFQCQFGHSPLVLLLNCLLCDSVEELIAQADDVIGAFEVLLVNGAQLNFVAGNQGTCATLIAMVCQKYFSLEDDAQYDTTQLDDKVNEHGPTKFLYAKLADRVLCLLLKYGLNANHKSSRTCPYPKGGSGNALIEFVRLTMLAKTTKDFCVIHMWLKTLFQWGANPDIEPYPSEPIICHSQSSIFLKKQGTQPVNHYIHEVKERESMFTDGRAQELLLLFYNTMEHAILYECLNAAKTMARYHPVDVNGRDFLSLLNQLSENPRSLKQIARVQIYKALDRQLAVKVDELPVPRLLKTYLLDIQ
ncbi:LOW QUALITY PROTEIN: uncharacterized protein LOC124263169 [Haliotis rubra]|uniref:LOW QUALITY PROTEIN: uncharacterized protein LOC124263169 n=1 Tax=Haliotis rubra TaxID=36100 RepID=UPI001EE57638|nr:LOW QUALITY PROTEIN: uncharacterized protein LOC124263169 [Haliotis rubra]